MGSPGDAVENGLRESVVKQFAPVKEAAQKDTESVFETIGAVFSALVKAFAELPTAILALLPFIFYMRRKVKLPGRVESWIKKLEDDFRDAGGV